MPALEVMDLKDWAVLWAKAGKDNYGDQTLESPVNIRCRWEETDHEAANPFAKTQGYDAVVVVDREIEIDSILWLGRIDCLPGTAETPEDNIFTVKKKSTIRDLKGRHARRVVYLMRHGDTLPALDS